MCAKDVIEREVMGGCHKPVGSIGVFTPGLPVNFNVQRHDLQPINSNNEMSDGHDTNSIRGGA